MIKNILMLLGVAILCSACKKEQTADSYASVNVVNAAIGAGTIKVNYFGIPVSWSSYSGSQGSLSFASNQILTVFNHNNDYPFTIVPALDTLKTVFSQNLALEPMKMYTLFTTGQVPTYDAVFVEEDNIQYNFADSAIAIRFINLSPNSPAVKITLASTPTVNEVAGLAYKQMTDFKKFPDLKIVPTGSLTFQVRDAVSNAILTSYTLPASAASPYTTVSTSLSRFKSVTLAIKGLAGTITGTNAYGLFPVAHY